MQKKQKTKKQKFLLVCAWVFLNENKSIVCVSVFDLFYNFRDVMCCIWGLCNCLGVWMGAKCVLSQFFWLFLFCLCDLNQVWGKKKVACVFTIKSVFDVWMFCVGFGCILSYFTLMFFFHFQWYFILNFNSNLFLFVFCVVLSTIIDNMIFIVIFE